MPRKKLVGIVKIGRLLIFCEKMYENVLVGINGLKSNFQEPCQPTIIPPVKKMV